MACINGAVIFIVDTVNFQLTDYSDLTVLLTSEHDK